MNAIEYLNHVFSVITRPQCRSGKGELDFHEKAEKIG